MFFAVPRVWEKLHEAIAAKVDETHGAKRVVVGGYLGLGLHAMKRHDGVSASPLWERLPYGALDAAVGRTIRNELAF